MTPSPVKKDVVLYPMSDRPNILLLMTDQQRWDTILGRSGCRTPNLNRLAGEGVSFERSYTPVSLCCPARAMLLTGAYGWHMGVYNQIHVPERMGFGIHDDAVTYASRLADAGYRTGYVGKWHAHWKKGPLDFGYRRASAPSSYGPEALERANFRPDDLYAHRAKAYPTRVSAERAIEWPGGGVWPAWREVDGPHEGRHAAFVADRGISLLEELAAEGRPWLLEVQWPEPHDPYSPHVDFASRYDWRDVELPSTWREEFVGKPGMNSREAASYNALSEEDVRQAIAHYWAYNEELDHHMGRVLAALEESGEADRTIVVATTDHGDLVGDHHLFIKGWMPYEETHRIPMTVRWPSVTPAGARATQLVQLHDLAHTFCAAAGTEPLPFSDGYSLSEVLADPKGTASRSEILNVYYGGEFLYTQRILITDRYKYVFNGFDVDELYDLEKDPHETINLIEDSEHETVRATLRAALRAIMERYGDPYADGETFGNLYHAGRYLPR
jgi:arylsulfatase A-like enzyme